MRRATVVRAGPRIGCAPLESKGGLTMLGAIQHAILTRLPALIRCRAASSTVGVSSLLLLCTLGLAACASTSSTTPVPIPITDYKMVAGRWQGTVSGLAGPRDEGDAVQLTIGEDGSYDFGVYRTIGAFTGKGKFELRDGKLTAQGERGRATYALYERDGRRYLRGDGVLGSGTPVTAEFRPAR